MTDFIRINNFIPSSTVNGPGKRFVIWTQGCNLNCEGCFNRKTHKLDGGFLIKISKLADLINNTKDIRGITFSGGEPLLQVNEIIKLIELVNKSLDIFIFSGYTIKEVISIVVPITKIKISGIIIESKIILLVNFFIKCYSFQLSKLLQ